MSPNVVKSITLGKDFLVFKSFPIFLLSLEELSIHGRYDVWMYESGLTIDSIPSRVRKPHLRNFWHRATVIDKLVGWRIKLDQN